MQLDDIRIYLPKYLSPESEYSLFEELKRFPENMDSRLYSPYSMSEERILQGDGIRDLLVVNLPDPKIGPANCMVLSNSCDMDPANKRLFDSRIVYAPIFNLDKYSGLLVSKKIKSIVSIESHIDSIKKQQVTQIFYLPKGGQLEHDSIVFFDRVSNCKSDFISAERLREVKLFSLSQYGHYLFLFKLSVHLTRVTEKLDRMSG